MTVTPESTTRPNPDGDSRNLSVAGLRAFFNITKAWGLSEQEQRKLLGEPSRSTYYRWKAGTETADPKRDTLERLSYILGIYKTLQILLPTASSADTWIKKANSAPVFGGRSALARMLGGNVGDLLAVRQYLDARRGGWT